MKYCSRFSGNDVVLGPALSVTHERTSDGIPIEQAICKKKLRPGSGFLSVSITTDGPTRVLQIADSKNKVGFQRGTPELEAQMWGSVIKP